MGVSKSDLLPESPKEAEWKDSKVIWPVVLNEAPLNGNMRVEEERVVAVMGLNGIGKSTFIQKALGSEYIKTEHEFISSSGEICEYRTIIDGRNFLLVDAPGFDDIQRSDAETLVTIALWLASTYASKKILSGILYLQDISVSRASASALRNMRILTAILGEAAFPAMVLVTTCWDLIDELLGGDRELRLVNVSFKPLLNKGAHVLRFDNTRASAHSLIQMSLNYALSFLHSPLDIQKELVDQNLRLGETTAGRILQNDTPQLIEKSEKRLESIRRQQFQALKAKDRTLLKDLHTKQVKSRVDLRKADRELQVMRSTFAKHFESMEGEEREWKEDSILLDQISMLGNVAPRFSSHNKRERSTLIDRIRPILLTRVASMAEIDACCARIVIIILRPVDEMARRARMLWQNQLGWIKERFWHSAPTAGYTQVAWTCICGVRMCSDVKERHSESLHKYFESHNIYDIAAAGLGGSTGQAERSEPLRFGSQSESSSEGSAEQSNKPQTPMKTPNAPKSLEDKSVIPSNLDPLQAPSPKYLALCLRAGQFAKLLEEVDITTNISDGHLFSKINLKLEEYKKKTTYRQLSALLSQVNGMAFIKFHHNRLREVGVLARPSLPPEEEVREKKYTYDPCPMEESPMESDSFIHYLLDPKSEHEQEFFYASRFPRKLNESFLVSADVGWGIQILEGPNWALFWIVMTICTLIDGLAAGLYAWLRRDNATAVALGAWLTTIQAMILTSVYFRWR